MTEDLEQPSTKGDLQKLRVDLSDEMKAHLTGMQGRLDSMEGRVIGMESRLAERIEEVIDQLNRGFRLTEESIRSDSAHVDEVDAMNKRLSRVEQHLGLGTE